MKEKISVIRLSICFLLVLSGCGGTNGAGSLTAQPALTNTTTISVLTLKSKAAQTEVENRNAQQIERQVFQATSSIRCGDVDGDGNIYSNDVLMVARASIGILTFTPEQMSRADVAISPNAPDGMILSNDLLIIARASIGMITSLNCPAGNSIIPPVCGNGILQISEQCDDGNLTTETCAYSQPNCAVCNSTCQLVAGATTYCSDGIINGSEFCDDGNLVSGDGCSAICHIETPPPTYYTVSGTVTQNGVPVSNANVTAVEPAVSTTTNSSGNFMLTIPSTGTITIQVTNTPTTIPQIATTTQQVVVAGDTTAQNIIVPPIIICGNGVINTGETCDTGAGNTNTACAAAYGLTCNYCNTSCQSITVTGAYCGDSVTNGTETCDNGTSNTDTACVPAYGSSCSYCKTTCVLTTVSGGYCGDGTINGAEQCDDSNTASGDGCSSVCQTETIPQQTYSGVKWGSNGSGVGQYDNPRGMAVNAAGTLYIADQNNGRVDITDANGVHQSYITGLDWPENPCVSLVDGRIAVTDPGNSTIKVFNSSGALIQTIGGSGNGDGQFRYPSGCAFDSSNNLYTTDDNDMVGDTLHHRVQVFDSSGTFVRKWGTRGTGDGQFYDPIGITIDSSGNVYVVEATNNRVQKFTSLGVYITKWGGTGSGNGKFSFPYYIGVDSSDRLYVMDFGNNRAQVFSSSGTWLYNISSPGSADGQILQAVGIAVTPAGIVYISDYNKDNVQKFTY